MACQYVVLAEGTFKAVTCLYRHMTHEALTPLLTLRQKWEEDLGEEIPAKVWAELVERAWKSSRNARFQLVHFFNSTQSVPYPSKN